MQAKALRAEAQNRQGVLDVINVDTPSPVRGDAHGVNPPLHFLCTKICTANGRKARDGFPVSIVWPASANCIAIQNISPKLSAPDSQSLQLSASDSQSLHSNAGPGTQLSGILLPSISQLT